ncbi:MAG: cobaltochelatase subunit CobN [Deltaproteobacteria bacterium]|nr:cobaltochelatase subunit CobN [Deltaproteobacteria bacterium]MBW2069255.1 cobaltochelatase subunit CobN [Deltaproteobacteria bacterium]
MKKVIVIVWQSYYNMLYRASKNVDHLMDIEVHSARALDNDPERFDRVLERLTEADLLLLYRSVESIWDRVEKFIRERKTKAKVICLSHDPAYWTLSNVRPEVVSRAYSYLVINGEENMTNMLKFLAAEELGVDVDYASPKEIPWEGLYHPAAEKVFSNVDDFLRWYEGYWNDKVSKGTVGILFARHYWINGNLDVENALIYHLEKSGFKVIPAFAYSVKDEALGTKGSGEIVLDWFVDDTGTPRIDAMVKLISFFLGSGRDRGELSDKDGASEGIAILKKLNVPCFCPISSYYKTVEEWEREELNLDIGWAIALPEFEGVIEPIIIAAQRKGEEDLRERVPIEDRIDKLVQRIERWIKLRKVPPSERKIAFVLHNNPCASAEATVGAGTHLDTLQSVVEIMKRMKEVGYNVDPPESGKALIDEIMTKKAISEFRWTTVEEIVAKGGAIRLLEKERYEEWFNELPEKTRLRMIEVWGNPPGELKDGIPPAMLYEGKIVITGVSYGNVLVMVQPKRGCAGARCDGQVCKILHDPHVPPPHQYIATYKWLSREFGAHAVVHVGTHGNLEFLPGKGVGLSGTCFPDIGIDTMPHLYIYNADNPPEGTIAKRRSYAVLVDHMQTIMTGSGLYEELAELDRLLTEYEETKIKDPGRAHALEHLIINELSKSQLDKEIQVKLKGEKKSLSELNPEELHSLPFEDLAREIHGRLSTIRNTQIQDGMHIFGSLPEGERRVDFIYSILRYDAGEEISLRREVAKLMGYDLAELLRDTSRVDEKTGKSYGAILEEIDMVSKDAIRQVLSEAGFLKQEDDHEAGSRNTVE